MLQVFDERCRQVSPGQKGKKTEAAQIHFRKAGGSSRAAYLYATTPFPHCIFVTLWPCTPRQAQQRRHDELSKELLAQSSHLLTLHKIISETQKNPAGAASFLDEGNEQLHSFRRGLSQLQSAMQPVSKDPCFARFIDKFLALPDPGNQLLKIHKLLKYDDFDEKKDEMEPMLRSNNGIITSSTHRCVVLRHCAIDTMPTHLQSASCLVWYKPCLTCP